MKSLASFSDLDLQEEVERRKKAKRELDELPPVRNLATRLHDMLCTWNHTDGCGWHYDKDWGPSSARWKWQERAACCLELLESRRIILDPEGASDLVIDIVALAKGRRS